MKKIFILFFVTQSLVFASVQPVSDAELINSAEEIVQATVISQACEWNTVKTVIFTFITIKIEKVYKGSLPLNSLQTIVIPGGYDPVTDLRLTISCQPTFDIDEKMVLYLSPARGIVDGINYQLYQDRPDFDSLKRVNFFSMGKNSIIYDQKSKTRMIFKTNENELIDLDYFESLLADQVKIHSRREEQ